MPDDAVNPAAVLAAKLETLAFQLLLEGEVEPRISLITEAVKRLRAICEPERATSAKS